MKQFFRLLIFSFGLLLVLGMSGESSGDIDTARQTSSILIFLDNGAGILPSVAKGTDQAPRVPVLQILPDHYRETELLREHTLSAGIQTCILSNRKNFMEFSPGVPGKTGHLLHFAAHRDDPHSA